MVDIEVNIETEILSLDGFCSQKTAKILVNTSRQNIVSLDGLLVNEMSIKF